MQINVVSVILDWTIRLAYWTGLDWTGLDYTGLEFKNKTHLPLDIKFICTACTTLT